jgi:uncharacterized protein YjiK
MRFIIAPILVCSVFLFSFKGKNHVPHCKFKFGHFKALKGIPEPSGIVYNKENGHYYVVSDHGLLFECDQSCRIIRKASVDGMDFEGVEVKDSFVYVSDETPRKVYKYRKSDLSLLRVFDVSWGGAANKAFESIAYNQKKKCFVLVSQDPVSIVEYDDNFREIQRYPFRHARDISDASWYGGNLYLLSNKDETIFKCDPMTYDVIAYYKINILNPEGLAFDSEGNVSITSDDLQRLYSFKQLPTITKQ